MTNNLTSLGHWRVHCDGSQKMFLILAQFFPELLLTMCKVIRIFLSNCLQKKNYKFYLFPQFSKTFLILEVQHIYSKSYNHSFPFISSYPNASINGLFGFGICCCVVFNQVKKSTLIMHSAQNNPTQPQFHQFISTKHAATMRQFDPGSWFLNYSTK